MKEHIIRTVFFSLFLVCFLTGIFSFTHEHDLFDSFSLLLGAMVNFLSWLALYRQKRNINSGLARFASDRRMGVFYILTALLFGILTVLSFHYTPELLTPMALLLCGATQLLGYRVFIRQQRDSARRQK